MQKEATQLKKIMSGNKPTKVIAIGVGYRISQSELVNIASSPASKNVFMIRQFKSLTEVKEQIVEASCDGQ